MNSLMRRVEAIEKRRRVPAEAYAAEIANVKAKLIERLERRPDVVARLPEIIARIKAQALAKASESALQKLRSFPQPERTQK
jgi:hypothetical protein